MVDIKVTISRSCPIRSWCSIVLLDKQDYVEEHDDSNAEALPYMFWLYNTLLTLFLVTHCTEALKMTFKCVHHSYKVSPLAWEHGVMQLYAHYRGKI